MCLTGLGYPAIYLKKSAMNDNIQALVAISGRFGQDREYVIAGGGNTSFKDENRIWVKASGSALAGIDENGFVCLDRKKLKVVAAKEYSQNSNEREQEVKHDLARAVLYPSDKRPSVETSLHEIIQFPFVVHTHPTMVNGLLCAMDSKRLTKELFGEDVVYVEYTDPGYLLYKVVDTALREFRIRKKFEPSMIFLENHGVFVGADSTEGIIDIYKEIEHILKEKTKPYKGSKKDGNKPVRESVDRSFKEYAETSKLKYKLYADELTDHYLKNEDSFSKVSKPFIPDHIVYCKSDYLFVENPADIVQGMQSFKARNGYDPKVIAVRSSGVIALEENDQAAQTVLDLYIDLMKISYITECFGGPRSLNPSQIAFIDNWEVENYRRRIFKTN
jgi:rhamnose utilization protein RhaD (predicted bifunctional aldolase and dehydrogenase)